MNPKRIYSWSNDFFCSSCLIYAMIPHEPWSQWAEEHDPSELSTEHALVSMADYFHLNLRSRNDRADMGFPGYAEEYQLDTTLFCAVCLTLLHQVP